MNSEFLVPLMFIVFFATLLTGIPIVYVLGGTGLIFCGVGYLTDVFLNTNTGLDFLTLGITVNRIFRLMDNWLLVAVPMFIFMGLMLNESGVAKKSIDSLQLLFGRVRGGLAISIVFVGVVLAASTGIVGASVVLLGTLALGSMLDQNYDRPLALGTIAASGTLGSLIPPSIMLVILADQMNLSVGDIFLGAVVPGFLLGIIYVTYIILVGIFNPEKTPLYQENRKLGIREYVDIFCAIAPLMSLILVVLGSIFFGIATPTEASGLGAAGAILLSAGHRTLTLPVVFRVSKATLNTLGYVFAIFVGATFFSIVLREIGGDEAISKVYSELALGPNGTLIASLVLVFLLGFLLDWIEISLIILPLIGSEITSLGLVIDDHGAVANPDLVWFTILFAMCLQTSFLTPPVGFAIFYLKGVCPPSVSIIDIYWGVMPFICIQLLGLVLVFLFPSLVIWLPSISL